MAEDAEDKTFPQRLEALYNSLSSATTIKIGEEVDSGKAYKTYLLDKPQGVKLILLVQGIETLNYGRKRAIEDYAIHIHKDTLNQLLKTCGYLLPDPSKDPKTHKKLALIAAILTCHNKLEELFHRITYSDIQTLTRNNDGLKQLQEILIG